MSLLSTTEMHFVTQSVQQATNGDDEISVMLITGDASFRRYYRVCKGTASFILLQSPIDKVDNQPFIELNQHFHASGLNLPKIYNVDHGLGLVLLEDLGGIHLADKLSVSDDENTLYHDVIDLIPRIAKTPQHSAMKAYDAAFIDMELEIFNEWLVEKFCNSKMDEAIARNWQQCKQTLLNAFMMQPQVTMHRDYHSRNIMLFKQNWYLIDYQDAVRGPLCYDLVSLLKDCYRVLPSEQHDALLEYGFNKLEQASLTQGINFNDFVMLYDLTGLQRHLKAAGIFCRLAQRDEKLGYLPHVLPTLSYVVAACRKWQTQFSCLGLLANWLETEIVPSLKETL